MDDFHIRPIEPRDVERAVGIVTRHDETDGDKAKEFFSAYFGDSDRFPYPGRHYVLETDDDLVAVGGYVRARETQEHWIGFLFVDPYYQGQGIGTHLLKRIVGDLRKEKIKHLYVTVDEEDIPLQTVRFYEVNGFHEAAGKRDPFFPPGAKGKVYEKALR